MAVQQLNFAATVEAWVHETEGAMEAVFKQSAQDVVAAAQVHCPVKTGFLRGSATVGINQEPADVKTLRGAEAYVLELLPAKLGDAAKVRWTANYGAVVEYGTRDGKRAGRGFVRQAAQQWPEIVRRNAARLGGLIGR